MHGYPPVKSQCRAGFHTHEDDDVDHESQIEFMRFFNTTIDLTDAVDELKQVRKRKLKKVADKIPPDSKNFVKGEISQCMKSFLEVVECLIDSRKAFTPALKLHESMKVSLTF